MRRIGAYRRSLEIKRTQFGEVTLERPCGRARHTGLRLKRRGGSEGDGGFEGAGDDAAAGGPGEQGAKELVGLGQEAKVEATVQVVAEVVEALELEGGVPGPDGRRSGSIRRWSAGVPAFCRLRRG